MCSKPSKAKQHLLSKAPLRSWMPTPSPLASITTAIPAEAISLFSPTLVTVASTMCEQHAHPRSSWESETELRSKGTLEQPSSCPAPPRRSTLLNMINTGTEASVSAGQSGQMAAAPAVSCHHYEPSHPHCARLPAAQQHLRDVLRQDSFTTTASLHGWPLTTTIMSRVKVGSLGQHQSAQTAWMLPPPTLLPLPLPTFTLTEPSEDSAEASTTHELSLAELAYMPSLPVRSVVPGWAKMAVAADEPLSSANSSRAEPAAHGNGNSNAASPLVFKMPVGHFALDKRRLCPPPCDARGRANCHGRWWSRRNMGYDFVRPALRRANSCPGGVAAAVDTTGEVVPPSAAGAEIAVLGGEHIVRPKVQRLQPVHLRRTASSCDPFLVDDALPDLNAAAAAAEARAGVDDLEVNFDLSTLPTETVCVQKRRPAPHSGLDRILQSTAALERVPNRRASSAISVSGGNLGPKRMPSILLKNGSGNSCGGNSTSFARENAGVPRSFAGRHLQFPPPTSPLEALKKTLLEQQQLQGPRGRATSPPPLPIGDFNCRRGALSGEPWSSRRAHLRGHPQLMDASDSEEDNDDVVMRSDDEDNDDENGLSSSSSVSGSEDEDDANDHDEVMYNADAAEFNVTIVDKSHPVPCSLVFEEFPIKEEALIIRHDTEYTSVPLSLHLPVRNSSRLQRSDVGKRISQRGASVGSRAA
ncbi:hypothetical protein K437DRAFT_59004 [Tilletiaria anomala UBC 951]|uniref:Uncharacterized protein n=1 Tax=Tilletiaria anomala (strain ATCC 24038 / CBS 436.72 / UBC 951) TaxID=1037660 RepID=A0A066VC36_TILAU|nr:uncharacterized protein K437DRAFT_59004 [Tilletiaria anomala UBC 951]KDN36165.1 hypothetical protein K437DRAFT_59004 [Tilletiaria anomala UBC 951]